MQEYICSRCNYTGPKAHIKPGSAKMEMVCWLLFPVGPFYTVYRFLGKRWGCPECGETVMVPIRSEFELRARAMHDAEEETPPPAPQPKPRRDVNEW